MLCNGDMLSPEENAMGWAVRFRPSSKLRPLSSVILGSYPDALTHARVLLDRDRGGVAEVWEEGSEAVVVYRLTEQGMVALGEISSVETQLA